MTGASFVPKKYHEFVQRFYRISDKPGAHAEYADCLGEEAVCNFSGAEHRGRQAIIKMREAMWEHIARRDHHPERIFVGDDGTDVVVWGSADFTRKSGEVFRTTFFARLAFEDPDAAQLRMSSYEVVKRQ